MQSIINRTKAIVAGRSGQPLLQPYQDLLKLARKSVVYSETTSVIFRAGPTVGLAAMICATALIPFGALPAFTSFAGDPFVLAGLLAIARFSTVLAALDTGSSFEAMGASREVTLAALAEPALLLAFAALARQTGSLSLAQAAGEVSWRTWMEAAPALALITGALTIVFLTENARIPVDDPTTHLELTMIHEVMVLDHSGPDLLMIEYATALKIWLLGAIIVAIVLPWHAKNLWLDACVAVAGMSAIAIMTGMIESSMARLRLLRVPQLLIAASVLSVLALALAQR